MDYSGVLLNLLTLIHSFVILFCGDLTIYSFTTFLPSILKGMGYTSIHANLLTVPVYIWALAVFIAAGLSSDRFKNRSIFIGGGFVCMIIGYAILISVETVGVRYFACYSKCLTAPHLSVYELSLSKLVCIGMRMPEQSQV